MKRRKRITVVLGLLLMWVGAAGGCSYIGKTLAIGESEFSCPPPDKGTGCMPPSAVYDRQKGGFYDSRFEPPQENKDKTKNDPPPAFAPPSPFQHQPSSVAYSPGLSPELNPVRTRVKIMRIWIAPWVDERESLHYPGYMFVDAGGPSWNYGEKVAGEYTEHYFFRTPEPSVPTRPALKPVSASAPAMPGPVPAPARAPVSDGQEGNFFGTGGQ